MNKREFNIEDLELDNLAFDDYEDCFTEEANKILDTFSAEDWVFLSTHALADIKHAILAVRIAYILGFRDGRKEV